MVDCANCIEKCPQAAAANEIAKGRMFAEREFINLINKIENGTLVEVVRCSECKHKGWIQEPCHGKSIGYCRQLERPVDKQFFCGLGERKGGDK